MELDTKYKNKSISVIDEKIVDKFDFSNATFNGVDAKGKSFRYCNLFDVKISENTKTDFSNTDLSYVSNLHTVKNLHTAIFNDDTKLDGINLEEIAKTDPILAHKLKQIRYIGRIKKTNKNFYKIWKISCDCGRSWKRLLVWASSFVFCFGVFFFICGRINIFILPHFKFIKDSSTLLPLSFPQSLQFSALSFVGFSMPQVTWDSTYSGLWTVAESWLGIAFLGLFVTVISTILTKNN